MRIQQCSLLVALILRCASAEAVCNNPKDWTESPANQVKVYFGYEEVWSHHAFATQTMTGLDVSPYPPPLPDNARPLPIAPDGDTPVSYYEPNPRGGWRICRIEYWNPYVLRNMAPNAWQENVRRQPALTPIAKTHGLGEVIVFLYDARGRIEQKIPVMIDGDLPPRESDPDCFRYDDKDRIVLWVSASITNKCPAGEPDIRDFWHRFRFAELNGETWSLWAENHYGKDNGSWSKTIFFIEGTDFNLPSGNAQADSERGVFRILGGQHFGLRDQSHGTRFKNSNGREKAVQYYFPIPPVPISMLEHVEKHLYDYPRRRVTAVTAGIELLEYFPPHQHEVRERFYVAPDGSTLRQEVYTASGQLKRVINLGFWGKNNSNGGFYDEDVRNAPISLRLKDNKLLYRVWDYDASGKAKLVAIGWNRRNGSAFFGDNNVFSAKIAFGTPDGKEKWASEEEFFKAFDFDPSASRAFPEWKK